MPMEHQTVEPKEWRTPREDETAAVLRAEDITKPDPKVVLTERAAHTHQQAMAGVIDALVAAAHHSAVHNGWYDEEPLDTSFDGMFPRHIALMHSELSEALEAWRKHPVNKTWYEVQDVPPGTTSAQEYWSKPEGCTSELADTVIRILDTAGRYGLPLGRILMEKMEYNKHRAYRHGGKKA